MPDRREWEDHLRWTNDELNRVERRVWPVIRDAVKAMIDTIVDALRAGRAVTADDLVAAARRAWQQHMPGMTRTLERVFTDVVTSVHRRTLRTYGTQVPELERASLQALAQNYIRAAENRLVGVPDQVWEMVAETLAVGYAHGDSPQQLARRVAEYVDHDGLTTQHRASRIARTESTMVFNTASLDALRFAGTALDEPIRKSWVSTRDGRTRATHRAVNGQTRALDEPFDVGGFALMFPGDPTGPPHEVINCRCVVSPVPGDVVPALTDEVIEQERQRMEADYLAANTNTNPASGPDPGVDVEELAAATRMPRHLVRYWTRGPGAARIGWGTKGDFARCKAALVPYVGPDDVDGTCSNLHKIATGHRPGRHASIGDENTMTDTTVDTTAATVAADTGGCGGCTGCPCATAPTGAGPVFLPSPGSDDTTATVEDTPKGTTNLAFTPPSTVASARLDSASIIAQAAANAPETPPAAWFEPRDFTELTPVTVTARGEVFGHMAPWDVPHRGIRHEDVPAPASRIDYDLFHSRDLITADGTQLRVGVLHVGCAHAPDAMDVADARDYHERACTPAAVVRAYEDDHGIAFAGSLLPGLTVEQVNQLTHLSGEWRSVQLELMAAVGVDDPGFPVAPLEATTVAVAASATTPTAQQARAMVSHIPRRVLAAGMVPDIQALAAAVATELDQLDQRRKAEARIAAAQRAHATYTIERLAKGQ